MKEKHNGNVEKKFEEFHCTPRSAKSKSRGVLFILCTLALLFVGPLQAAEPVLVKNINTSKNQLGFNPRDLIIINNQIIFTAFDSSKGVSLWKSDGTIRGTTLLKDVNLADRKSDFRAQSFPDGYYNFRGEWYFLAYGDDDSFHGSNLWKTNGTTDGTIKITGVSNYVGTRKNEQGKLNGDIIEFNNKLYFSRIDGLENGLWQFDGTLNGMVKIFNFSSNYNQGPVFLGTTNAAIYFIFYEQSTIQLWKTDGTQAGTKFIRSQTDIICCDTEKVEWINWIGNEVVTNDGKYFDKVEYNRVHATVQNEIVYFKNNALWKTTNNYQSSEKLADLPLGSVQDNIFSFLGNRTSYPLHFYSNDKLGVTDGTANGTVFLNTKFEFKYLGDSIAVGNNLYLSGTTIKDSWEFWKTDGTEAGTKRVKLLNTGWAPWNLVNLNGVLSFVASNEAGETSLWKSDGTEFGTELIKKNVLISSNPLGFTEVNGNVFFTAEDATHGRELWKSDGTSAGSVMIKDIKPGEESSDITIMTEINGTVFFSARNGKNGIELWKSDGTASGTVMIKDINTATVTSNHPDSPGHSNPKYISTLNGVIYFNARDGVHGYELWKTDGTAMGTVMVKDINTNPVTSSDPNAEGHSSPQYLGTLNGAIYFSAKDNLYGTELWKTNGTASGTVMVKDINPYAITGPNPLKDNGHSNPQLLTTFNGNIYFSARDGYHGIELWRTNGTASGTVLVKDNNPAYVSGPNPDIDTGHSNLKYLDTLNNKLFFAGVDSSGNKTIIRSDGTKNGTTSLYDFGSQFDLSPVGNLNGKLLFRVDEREVPSNYRLRSNLWKTDGTTAGTSLFSTIPIYYQVLIKENDAVYFLREDSYMLSKTTDAIEIQDVSFELYLNQIYNLSQRVIKSDKAVLGYFSGNKITDYSTGYELWRLP